ncbi:DUF3139 domain-containing protein [Paenibacillus sp. KN14-4R]|uniref:DUF3139 domain-containing protein n=1 Tax=Paenibacillus sp. KN14-4R TaxID=3445773 RepID=UPI003FA06BBF
MKKIILISIISVLLLIYPVLYIKSLIHMNNLESELKLHLINDKHYSDTDIKSMKAYHGKMPEYWLDVIFNDEPNVIYKYTDRNAGDWVQIYPNTDAISRGKVYKHSEVK